MDVELLYFNSIVVHVEVVLVMHLNFYAKESNQTTLQFSFSEYRNVFFSNDLIVRASLRCLV